MNKKQLIVAWAIGVFFIVLGSTSLSFSQTKNIYYNSGGHFSFVVPDGWEEFSKDTLCEFAKAMNRLPGAKTELITGFYDAGEKSTYMLLKIKKSGKWSENTLKKIVSDNTLKQVAQDRANIFRDYGDFKFNETIYDDKRHILYMKLSMSTDIGKTLGGSATMFSNYGSVTIVFYALEKDFNTASSYFSQIIDSFNFDKGYQYFDGQE